LSLSFLESQPGDEPAVDEAKFAIEIDMGLLDDAVAAVERREAEAEADERTEDETEGVAGEFDNARPVDLAELAAVEAELMLEIVVDEGEDEDKDDADLLGLGDSTKSSAEVRIRAMEAESERDNLRDKMDDLQKVKSEIEAKLQRIEDRALRARASSQNAIEAQAVAEERAKRLRDALEKQQKDVERLLKRRKKEHRDQYGRGRADAALTLVEVLDNLLLALGHAESDPLQVVSGVEMVVQQFKGNLKRLGVEMIPSDRGMEFDPSVHEALTNEADDALEPGQIVNTVTRGYVIDGKLLRAARVCVAAGPSEE
jgi:molecular chaperone GrpE